MGRFPRGLGEDPYYLQRQVGEKHELYDPEEEPFAPYRAVHSGTTSPDKSLALDTFRISFTPAPGSAAEDGLVLPPDLKARISSLPAELTTLPGCVAVLYARELSFRRDICGYDFGEPVLGSRVDTAADAFVLLVCK